MSSMISPVPSSNIMVIQDFRGPAGQIIDSIWVWVPAGQSLPVDCRYPGDTVDNLNPDNSTWDKFNSSADFDIDLWESENEKELSASAVSRHKPKYAFGSELDYISLPGLGEQTGDKCGKVLKAAICSCGERRTFGYNCHHFTCPVCYEGAATRAAESAKERIYEGVKTLITAGILTGKRQKEIKHLAYSPPQDMAIALLMSGIEGYRKLIKMGNKIMISSGFSGAVDFHPYRQNNPQEDNFNPDMEEYVWYLSPHFHGVGFGYIEPSDKFYARTGWIYKNIGLRDGPDSIKATISYTLTHHGVVKGAHAVRYIGLLSYNKLVIDTIEKFDTALKCPKCGEDLRSVFVDFSGEPHWDILEGVLWVRNVRRTLKLSPSFKRQLSKNEVSK